MNEQKAKKPFKRTIKKRSLQPPPIHPHIEQIQTEINSLQAELDELKVKEEELTEEERMKKQITEACLEKYQTTLKNLTDTEIKDKLRAYHENYIEKEIKYKVENQTLALLQFLYIVRLAQFGLFSAIQVENASEKLFAVNDFCDQLIGASVYAAKDPSYKIRSQKRKFVFEALKKFELSSEDTVTTINDVTFKQIKTLFDDIWNNTIDEKRALDRVHSEDPTWLIIPADSPVPDHVTLHTNQNEPSLSTSNEEKQNEQEEEEEEESADIENNVLNENDKMEIKELDDKVSEQPELTIEAEGEDHEEDRTHHINGDTLESKEEYDYVRKHSESEQDNWRNRGSIDNNFRGRGRGIPTIHGFRRGTGRGRYIRGRGARGMSRGRGRGRGYDRNDYVGTE
ncbi:hypothetical protein G6F70_005196 [Rhizopus microsporus]|uniref:Caprin-1 dimerization domain-containing protein n=2 Tax=Rhizopus TaxID=4842 RepID=A0A367K6Z4_RHIAZ|nr:hypothetical protein G6F71_002965 [Rhizopus microsporus]RCH98022.1 hypothetical protein CU097_014634 [Rhizopus azygosporus]KAG1199117.1 hypothetical protein G6F70_005196 [Rhizopus microsporus]KAG1210944.1 hypothetical protein G6F69_005015 [Rhizopus microsporus]KAG1232783.1 hypothetical protein G6F67_004748 [Rhizopus microsporus]